MRYWIISALFIIGQNILFAQGKSVYFNNNRPVNITGSIKNYQPDSKNGFITFRVSDLNSYKDTAIAISRDGKFTASLYQSFNGDMAFIYRTNYNEFYGRAGDQLNFVIDDALWEKSDYKAKAFSIEREFLNMSHSLSKWNHTKNNWTPRIKADWENKDLSDELFARDRMKELNEEKSLLQSFNKTEKLNKFVYDWIENSLSYNAAFEISFHCFAGKVNDKIHDSTLMRYLKGIPLNNSAALNNSYYYRYLRLLAGDYQIIVNLHKSYKEETLANGKNPLDLYLRQVDKYAKGITHQIMYYDTYIGTSTRFTDGQEDKFEKKITDPVIANDFKKAIATRAKKFESYDVADKIRKDKAPDSTKTRLLSILSDLKNDYVFIDFWGSWCGPCMSEMPHYPSLMDSLKTLPVKFVFFAVDTKDEKVNELRKSFPQQAVFVNLTDNETRLMNNLLGFSSYPSHFILAPQNMLLEMKMGSIATTAGLSQYAVKKLKETIK